MTPTPDVQDRIRRYLLGQLTEADRTEIERSLMTDEGLLEEVLAGEDELIDEYLSGELPQEERSRFEQHFLSTPERHGKLRFARAFDKYLSNQVQETPVSRSAPSPSLWAQAFSSPLRMAAFALVLLAIGLGVWRVFFHQSEIDKGLLALNAAYREQRPVEARLSGLNYAPYSTTRGSETGRVDQNELRRAERTFLDELERSPAPAARQGLGEVYLAKRDFDRAIEQFDEVLKSDPRNPKLFSDLGAAWLEKGRAYSEAGDRGKATDAFSRSVENLNKALEINSNLPEPVFNRALCFEYLGRPRDAEIDWRKYLEIDSASGWASEARQHLKRLENEKAPRAGLFDSSGAISI